MIRQLKNLVGVDVGCTNIKMTALVGDNLIQEKIPSGDNLSKNELIKIVSKFYNSFNYDFKGLGIAFSGYTTDNIHVTNTTLKCLKNLSIYDFNHLNCQKIKLINDSNASVIAGLIEYPSSKVLIGITNGTGIGCGIIINGNIFTGASGLAGEIYGNPVIYNNEITKVGRICSGSRIFKNIQKELDNKTNLIRIGSTYMGIVIVSLIHSYNPNVVYLSGGGFEFPGYIENLKNFVSQYAYSDFLTNLEIVQTSFGAYSGCFGAMRYVLNS